MPNIMEQFEGEYLVYTAKDVIKEGYENKAIDAYQAAALSLNALARIRMQFGKTKEK